MDSDKKERRARLRAFNDVVHILDRLGVIALSSLFLFGAYDLSKDYLERRHTDIQLVREAMTRCNEYHAPLYPKP